MLLGSLCAVYGAELHTAVPLCSGGAADLVFFSCWHVYISPLPLLPRGRVYTTLFFVSMYKDYLLLRPPRGPKNKQLLQQFATQFMVLLKRRGKRTECQGGNCSCGKIWKPFKSSAATVFQSRGTYSLTYAIISHAQLQSPSRGFV